MYTTVNFTHMRELIETKGMTEIGLTKNVQVFEGVYACAEREVSLKHSNADYLANTVTTL